MTPIPQAHAWGARSAPIFAFAALLALSTAAAPAAGAPLAQLQPRTEVTIRDDAFEPETVTIAPGGIVRWTNQGDSFHTSTSRQGLWDSGTMSPGAIYSVRFLSPGTYTYYCRYHGVMMSGTVIVGDVGPLPTATSNLPPPMPGADAIVYADFPGNLGAKELFAIQPDGSSKVQLTNTASDSESQPSWSPERSRVAYTAEVSANRWGIHLLDLPTGQVRTLTGGSQHFEPDWKPDGSVIAFSAYVPGVGLSPASSAIRVVQPDGGGLRTLVQLNGGDFTLGSPTWSPDGTRIAFVVGSPAGGGELYVMNADGSGARNAFPHAGWDDIDPAWSPDGRRLAFSTGFYRGSTASTRHDIAVLDLETMVFGTVAVHASQDMRRPAWSSDGGSLVFDAKVDPNPQPLGRWALFTVPSIGGAVFGPLSTGVESDWGSAGFMSLPTPPPPTATSMAPFPTDPATPVFPTPPFPFPTPPGEPTPLPTPPDPLPTFPAATATFEATPTQSAGTPVTPGVASPTPPIVVRGRVHLPRLEKP